MARQIFPLLLAAFASFQEISANNCSTAPIPLPTIQSVSFDKTARSPDPASTITLRTQHPLLDYHFFVGDYRYDGFFFVKQFDDFSETNESTTGEHVLKVFAETDFDKLSLIATFDLGCYPVSILLVLSRGPNGIFWPLKVGKVAEFPPLNRVVNPGQWYKMRFALKSRKMAGFRGQVLSYRTEDGLVQHAPEAGVFPKPRGIEEPPVNFQMNTYRPYQDPELHASFPWPQNMLDMTFMETIDIKRQKPFDFLAVAGYMNVHTANQTESKVTFLDIGSESDQVIIEGGGVRLRTTNARFPMLTVSLSGNPLPEVSMEERLEFGGNGKSIKPVQLYPDTDTYAIKHFIIPERFSAGDLKRYSLAIKKGSGMTNFRRVVVEGYDPEADD